LFEIAGESCPHTGIANNMYNYREVPVPDLAARDSLVFAVMACSDAHLALSSSLNMSVVNSMGEIVLGAGQNTYSSFRACPLGCQKM
jgi:hypothetical protein